MKNEKEVAGEEWKKTKKKKRPDVGVSLMKVTSGFHQEIAISNWHLFI